MPELKRTEFTETVDLMTLRDPSSRIAQEFDELVAAHLMRGRDSLLMSDRKVLESRYVVHENYREMLAEIFYGYTLVYRNVESSANAEPETYHAMLLAVFYDTLGDTSVLPTVYVGNDIFDVVSNVRRNVVICTLDDGGYQACIESNKRIRLDLMFQKLNLTGVTGNRIASFSYYHEYITNPTSFYTTVYSNDTFYQLVHDCFHCQLSQLEVALLVVKFGCRKGHGLIPYIPEVLLPAYRDRKVTLKEYDMVYRVDSLKDELIIRSMNSDYIDMKYKLSDYINFLTRKVLYLGSKIMLFELKNRYGRFIVYSCDLIESKLFIPSNYPAVHAIYLPDMSDMYCMQRYKLKNPGLDVTNPDNYESYRFLAPKEAVDATRAYAAPLDQSVFSVTAIRRRLATFCCRRIIGGSSVVFGDFVSAEELGAITNDIFVELYIQRHDGGETLKLLRDRIAGISDVESASLIRLCLGVAFARVKTLYDATVGVIDNYVRSSVVDNILRRTKSLPYGNIVYPEKIIFLEFNCRQSAFFSVIVPKCTEISDVKHFSTTRALMARMPIALVPLELRSRYDKAGTYIGPKGKKVAVRHTVHRSLDTKHVGDEHRTNVNIRRSTGADYFDVPDSHGLHTVIPVMSDSAPDPHVVDNIKEYVGILNEAYLEAFPDQQRYPMTDNQITFDVNPYSLNMTTPHYEIRPYNASGYKEKHYIESKIHAVGNLPVQQTQRNTIQAVNSRNIGPPDLFEARDLTDMSNIILRTFFATHFIEEWETELAHKAIPQKFYPSYQALAEKYSQLEPHKLRAHLESDEVFELMAQDRMKCMIKSVKKPPNSDGGHYKADKSQTIVYDETHRAVEHSALAAVSFELFRSLLHPRSLFMDKKSSQDIVDFLNSYDPFDPSVMFLESDISMADKSNLTGLQLVLVCDVLRVLRLHVIQREGWFKSLDKAVVRAIDAGLRFWLVAQIKSGQWNTWFINAIGTAMAQAFCVRMIDIDPEENEGVDIEKWFNAPINPDNPQPKLNVRRKFHWYMHTGDDGCMSCIEPYSEPELAQLHARMSKMFNFEVKVFQLNTPYFASSYVVIDHAERRAYFIPDPLKVIEKKSYYVSAHTQQWHDYWQSFKDSLAVLGDPRVRKLLADVVRARTAKPLLFLDKAIDALYYVSSNYDTYRSLYAEKSVLL